MLPTHLKLKCPWCPKSTLCSIFFWKQNNQKQIALYCGAKVLLPAIIRCIKALEVCQPAFPPLLILKMITACLIFQHHFEAEPSLREQALQSASLVALLTM